jgi:hypothetical protein
MTILAEYALEQARQLLETIAELKANEKEILDDYIGEWITLEEAKERLVKLDEK